MSIHASTTTRSDRPLRPLAPRAACAAMVVAAIGALSACSAGYAGTSAPQDASVGDFCAVVKDAGTSDAAWFASRLARTGTPTSIPADARAGFEVMVAKVASGAISRVEQDQVKAFVDYSAQACSTAGG